jgi:hypothetical protein
VYHCAFSLKSMFCFWLKDPRNVAEIELAGLFCCIGLYTVSLYCRQSSQNKSPEYACILFDTTCSLLLIVVWCTGSELMIWISEDMLHVSIHVWNQSHCGEVDLDFETHHDARSRKQREIQVGLWSSYDLKHYNVLYFCGSYKFVYTLEIARCTGFHTSQLARYKATVCVCVWL